MDSINYGIRHMQLNIDQSSTTTHKQSLVLLNKQPVSKLGSTSLHKNDTKKIKMVVQC